MVKDDAQKNSAALYDAVRAVSAAVAGQRPVAQVAERLAMLLVQNYNQLLTQAEQLDRHHDSRYRFDVIGGLELHEPELAASGIARGGEGALTLRVEALHAALRERPSATTRALREAAGVCALLSAWLSRASSGLGNGVEPHDYQNPARDIGPTFSAKPADASNSPNVRIWHFDPPPSAADSKDRPTFFA
jgi:hypothetical protein